MENNAHVSIFELFGKLLHREARPALAYMGALRCVLNSLAYCRVRQLFLA